MQSCCQHQALSARKARGAGKQLDQQQQQQQQGPYLITRSAATSVPARDCTDSMPAWLQDASQQRSSWQQHGLKQQQQQQQQLDQETSVGSDAMVWSPAKGSGA
jgi:hypothetical protein